MRLNGEPVKFNVGGEPPKNDELVLDVALDQNSVNAGGLEFSYELKSGPFGKVYWDVLTKPEPLTGEEIRLGSTGLCGGYHKITDNEQHVQGVVCELKPGITYWLWIAVDADGMGKMIKLVTPAGLRFQYGSRPNQRVADVEVSVDQNSVSKQGVRFDYQLINGQSGGRIYYDIMQTDETLNAAEVRDNTKGLCGGYRPLQDDVHHEQFIDCALDEGQYYLWIATDIDGRGTNMNLVTKRGMTFSLEVGGSGNGNCFSKDHLAPDKCQWTNRGVDSRSYQKCKEACLRNDHCFGIQYPSHNCDFIVDRNCDYDNVYRQEGVWKVESRSCFDFGGITLRQSHTKSLNTQPNDNSALFVILGLVVVLVFAFSLFYFHNKKRSGAVNVGNDYYDITLDETTIHDEIVVEN